MNAAFSRILAALPALLLLAGCGDPASLQPHAHEEPTSAPAARVETTAEHDRHDESPDHIDQAVAGPGRIRITTELPGEVRINGNRMAHVTPRVGGIAVEVFKSLGDSVREGEVLAVFESRELADLKARYLAAVAGLELAQAEFQREQQLYEQRVSAEQDFLAARKARAEARIGLRSAQQKLLAIGFTPEELADLPQRHDSSLVRFSLSSPSSGVIIDRRLTRGESVAADTAVFTVADLATVWVDLKVYQKDIGAVRAGQEVRLATDHGDNKVTRIGFVQPLVGEDTRTALARVEVANPDGHWHPGCFVTGTVTLDEHEVAVAVPPAAVVQMDDGDTVVFVPEGAGFSPRPVVLGAQDDELVELRSGLEAGEAYVRHGAFSLKAERLKGSFGHGHAH